MKSLKKNKRILFVSSCMSEFWAGCEHLWTESCLYLHLNGYNVTASHHLRKGYQEVDDRFQSVGIPLIHHSGSVKMRRFFRTHSQLHFEQVLHKFKPDLVLISEGQQFESYFFMNTCRQQRIPYAVVMHAAPQYEWQAATQDVYFRVLYETAKKVYFVSKTNLRHFRAKIQSQMLNAEVVCNPYNVPYKQEFIWPKSESLQIAVIGSAVLHRKGQDIVFDILSQRKWQERDIKITMFANGNESEVDRLHRLKAFFKATNIEISDFKKHTNEIWNDHHLLLCPSRREGLPISIVEAMLCGRPCLVTDVDGNPELIEDEQTGYICKGYSYQELESTLEKMYQNKDKLPEIGRAAFDSIRQKIPENPTKEFSDKLIELLADMK